MRVCRQAGLLQQHQNCAPAHVPAAVLHLLTPHYPWSFAHFTDGVKQ